MIEVFNASDPQRHSVQKVTIAWKVGESKLKRACLCLVDEYIYIYILVCTRGTATVYFCRGKQFLSNA